MIVNIEDLEVGDEILIGSGMALKWLKILRKPMLGKKKHYRTSALLYKSVYCSGNITEQPYSRSWTDSIGLTHTRNWTLKEWMPTGEDHNVQKYINLNYRTIWLIKKEEK